jgi:N-acetylmuramoyl-L-alanine amidase
MNSAARSILSILILISAAASVPAETFTVAIDVGHTKVSPGAISVTGKPEYEFNLRIARKLEEALKSKPAGDPNTIRPFIISSEKPMSLERRTRLAASNNADLFVSIHHDSAQDKYLKDRETDEGETQKFTDRFSGYSIFVSKKNPRFEESFALARRIGQAMQKSKFTFARHHNEAIAGENRPIIDPDAGVYAFDDLVVLKTASMPAVLVECGVILNPKEEQDLLTSERQATIVAAIVRGIRDYLGNATIAPRVLPAETVAPRVLPAEKVAPSRPTGGVIIETSTPSPSHYPKPGATPSPSPPRGN